MSRLQLFASGPGTGKTTRCIELFRKEIQSSPGGLESRAFFVLPNREHAGRIQNLVLRKEIPGLFNVHILTFQELCLRFAGYADTPAPGESVRQMILGRLLEDKTRSWPFFAHVRDLPGLRQLLSEMIQEFSQAGWNAGSFAERSKHHAKDLLLKAKCRDVADLLSAYEEELSVRGLAEPGFERLDVRYRADEAPLVILDGFYHFTAAQKHWIGELAKAGCRMIATLTLPGNAETRPHVFDLVRQTRQFLLRIGFEDADEAQGVNHRASDPALRHLEANLFLPEPSTYEAQTDALNLFSAETLRGEIEHIAREILKIHRESPWHYSDMAIILRSVREYERLIAPVFREYGIPVSIHERRRMLESGPGRHLHRILCVFLNDWPAEDLLSVLRSGYTHPAVPPGEVTKLERAVFAGRVRTQRQEWLREASDLPRVPEALDSLARLEDAWKGARSARILRLSLTEFLESLPDDGALSDSAAVNALRMLVLRAESAHMGAASGGTFDAQRFLEELRSAIEVSLFSERPSGKNRVQVYDAVMALPKEYRVVFVAGLLDGVFPQPVREDALFKDDERTALNAGQTGLDIRSIRHAGERYFFYMVATRAKERLYLSHPRKDRDGRSLLVSSFLEEVRRCFRDLPVLDTAKIGEDPSEWAALAQARRSVAYTLFRDARELSAPAREGVLAYAASLRRTPDFSRILEENARSAQVRLKDPRILEQLAGSEPVYSPTRLETFLTCPFRYFARHALKLEPYLEDRLRAETGTLLHAVLEDYLSQRLDPKEIFGLLEKRFSQSPLAAEPPFRRSAIVERAARTLRRFLRMEEELHGDGFRPAHFELAFGRQRDGSAASLPYLRLGGGAVSVGGIIDRVDISEDKKAARVIDYKLGRRDLNKKLKDGTEVQLPLYLLVVRDLLKLKPASAELRFLESGEASGIKTEEIPSLLEETQERVLDADRRLRSGDIAVRSKSCDHCDYASVCRFETWRLIYQEADRV